MSEGSFISSLGHINIIRNVILRYARNNNINCLVSVIHKLNGISNFASQNTCDTRCDNSSVLRQGQLLALSFIYHLNSGVSWISFSQSVIFFKECIFLIRHLKINIQTMTLAIFHLHHFLTKHQRILQQPLVLQLLFLATFNIIKILKIITENHHHIIVMYLVELLITDSTGAVPQRKTNKHQECTTANSYNRHQNSSLITCNIPQSRLPGKCHPLPKSCHPLQKKLLASLWRNRTHKICRLMNKLFHATKDCHPSHEYKGDSQRTKKHDRTKFNHNTHHRNREAVKNKLRQCINTNKIARHNTYYRCDKNIDHIAADYRGIRIAKRCERSHLPSFLSDHSGHCIGCHQNNNDYKENRNNVRNRIHLFILITQYLIICNLIISITNEPFTFRNFYFFKSLALSLFHCSIQRIVHLIIHKNVNLCIC